MNVIDILDFLAEHDSAMTVMVCAHGEWHPVDAVTLVAGPDGGLAVRLEAADAGASASPRGGVE